ncbi:hypothetical protein KFE80_01875 [bacterium SCSIO 12696]|nr:hypothetical protein KFE80_01875 [bacterium SCSIO 12696]
MTANKKQQPASEADFHGAAIIGDDGQEVLITEDMVKDACEKLDEAQADDSAPKAE